MKQKHLELLIDDLRQIMVSRQQQLFFFLSLYSLIDLIQ